MGMYTEINVCFDLHKDIPIEVVKILCNLIDNDVQLPDALPKHEFFNCTRWRMIARGSSCYFAGVTNSKMVYDSISKIWKINIRASLKNYDSEIEKFLDWVAPYIKTYGLLGYIRYEEYNYPYLIFMNSIKKGITIQNIIIEE